MAVLLGKISILNTNAIPLIKVDGLWAMTEEAFSREIVGEKSKFEMILSNEEYKINSKNLDPITYLAKNGGIYNATGYFNLFQTNGENLKVDEKDIVLTFTKNKSPSSSKSPSRSSSPTPPSRSISPLPDKVGIMFNITGNGMNNFGKFQVTGILDNNGNMKLFKLYPIDTTEIKIEKPVRKRVEKVAIEDTTMEILKRSRRPSTSLLESLEELEQPVSPRSGTSLTNTSPRDLATTTHKRLNSSPRSNTSSANLSSKTLSRNSSSSNLSSTTMTNFNDTPNKTRIETKYMLSCTNLLRELKGLPQSLWFHEPVNHVALGLTDYLDVVKVPMDFETIDINLKQGNYNHPEEFGKHVKLVFNNAITYNKDIDNPCSIAAKELLEYFDKRFRKLCSEYSTSLTEAGYDWKSKKNNEIISNNNYSNNNNNNNNVIVKKKIEIVIGPRVNNTVELSDKVGNMEHLVVIQDIFRCMKLEMKTLGLDKNKISISNNEINVKNEINNNNSSSNSNSNNNNNSSSIDIDLNDNNKLNERRNLLINKIMNLDVIPKENIINILRVIDSTVISDKNIDKIICESNNDEIIELNQYVNNLNVYTIEIIESSIP